MSVAHTWSDIEAWVSDQVSEKRIYRGVGDNRYALQSTAHREGFFDLDRYLSTVMPAVARELAHHHGMHFEVAKPEELAELLAVSRHHGFPTPVMDWSSLPWVSLYFAADACKASTPFRIYGLKRDGLEAFTSIGDALISPSMFPALVEIHSDRTPRIAAQHGLFMLTPCVDVVVPLTLLSDLHISQRLASIDIPSSMREEVLQRLDRMGINGYTMTPSLDETLSRLKSNLLASTSG